MVLTLEKTNHYAVRVTENIDSTMKILEGKSSYQRDYKKLIHFLYSKCRNAPARMYDITTQLKSYFSDNGNPQHFFEHLRRINGKRRTVSKQEQLEAWYAHISRTDNPDKPRYCGSSKRLTQEHRDEEKRERPYNPVTLESIVKFRTEKRITPPSRKSTSEHD